MECSPVSTNNFPEDWCCDRAETLTLPCYRPLVTGQHYMARGGACCEMATPACEPPRPLVFGRECGVAFHQQRQLAVTYKEKKQEVKQQQQLRHEKLTPVVQARAPPSPVPIVKAQEKTIPKPVMLSE